MQVPQPDNLEVLDHGLSNLDVTEECIAVTLDVTIRHMPLTDLGELVAGAVELDGFTQGIDCIDLAGHSAIGQNKVWCKYDCGHSRSLGMNFTRSRKLLIGVWSTLWPVCCMHCSVGES
ncbi:hypothetical protein D3C87_1648790 [compost metagenome]